MPVFSTDSKIASDKKSKITELHITKTGKKFIDDNNVKLTLAQIEAIPGVYGVTFVGSSAVGLATDNKADIDMAIIVDPERYDDIAKKMKKLFTNAKVIGARDDGVPYVLNYKDMDLLIVPYVGGMPIDIQLRNEKMNAVSLHQALDASPVSRTPFHLTFFRSLSEKERAQVLALKRQLKAWGLYRDGVSTLQIAALVREAGKKKMTAKQFILSPHFEQWIHKVTDPVDEKRFLWASVAQRPWLIKLFKQFAAGVPNIETAYKNLAKGRELLKFEFVGHLDKDKRNKVDMAAKQIERFLHAHRYRAEIIDADTKTQKIVIAVEPERQKFLIDRIPKENLKKALYTPDGKLKPYIKFENGEYYRYPKEDLKELIGEITRKFGVRVLA